MARKQNPFARLEFSQAAERWLEIHGAFVGSETIRDYKQCVKSLCFGFAGKLLASICIEDIRDFQTARQSKAGNTRINKECSVLQQILKEADLWAKLEKQYRPFKVVQLRIGKPLTPEEENRLRKVVEQSGKQWGLAGHCLLLMAHTTCGFGEIRRLKREDVDLERKMLHVHDGAKNTYRIRSIPLNDHALRSAEYLTDRWKKIGGAEPSQFLLPQRAHMPGDGWNFSKPMGTIKTAWYKIRKAANLPGDLRIYDMRVHAITKLLSNPKVSPQVAKEIAGHISQRMQDHYSHQLVETKRAAVAALDSTADATPIAVSSTALMGRFLR